MKRLFLAILILFGFSSISHAEYATSRTTDINSNGWYTHVAKSDDWLKREQIVVWDWESTAAGAVSSTVPVTGVSGLLIQAIFIPGTGSRTPTAGYNVTISTGSGTTDLLFTYGTSLSATAPTRRMPLNTEDGFIKVLNESLYVNVTGAGNRNRGTVILIFDLP